jgi:hypothetical protein
MVLGGVLIVGFMISILGRRERRLSGGVECRERDREVFAWAFVLGRGVIYPFKKGVWIGWGLRRTGQVTVEGAILR